MGHGFVTPWTVAHQAPLSMGFSRQKYWTGLPFPSPGDLNGPGTKPVSPALASGFFSTEPLGETSWGNQFSSIAQSCLTLCNPMDCSPPSSSVHGILQARILECVVPPSSQDEALAPYSVSGEVPSSFLKFLLKAVGESPFPCHFQLPEVPTLLGKGPHITLTSASDITSPFPIVLPPSFTYKNLCDHMGSTWKIQDNVPSQDS